MNIDELLALTAHVPEIRALFDEHLGESAESEIAALRAAPDKWALPDELCDAANDLINDIADWPLTLSWVTGFPGGDGANWLRELGGVYFIQSTDYEPKGPFRTLKEALEQECFNMVTPEPEISSSLGEKATMRVARNVVDSVNGGTVLVNGVRYRQKGRKLIPDE